MMFEEKSLQIMRKRHILDGQTGQIQRVDTMIFCLMQACWYLFAQCKFANQFANYELRTRQTTNSLNYELIEQP